MLLHLVGGSRVIMKGRVRGQSTKREKGVKRSLIAQLYFCSGAYNSKYLPFPDLLYNERKLSGQDHVVISLAINSWCKNPARAEGLRNPKLSFCMFTLSYPLKNGGIAKEQQNAATTARSTHTVGRQAACGRDLRIRYQIHS